MKMNGNLFHAAVAVTAGILIAISSSMAYALPDLMSILAMLGACACLLAAIGLVLKKGGIVKDTLILATTMLDALAFSRILAGRANLMGYVWFSDLESGNQVAVTALWLAVAAMALCFVGILINVVSGFLPEKK